MVSRRIFSKCVGLLSIGALSSTTVSGASRPRTDIEHRDELCAYIEDAVVEETSGDVGGVIEEVEYRNPNPEIWVMCSHTVPSEMLANIETHDGIYIEDITSISDLAAPAGDIMVMVRARV